MRSSNRPHALCLGLVLLLWVGGRAQAQQQTQGFAVERLYQSAPGGGWLVMDALDMHGGLGGALALTMGYANNPLRVADGPQRLSIVSDQAFADFGAAVTYGRWRAYLDLDMPLVIDGQSGTLGGFSIAAPSVNLGTNPDTLTDARIGVDVRVIGESISRFRLGAGAQLFVPNGSRRDYDTDGTFRAMGRVLFAGDEGHFTYAGQLGVHVRPLDDSPAPGSPRGSELLFGVAAGAKLPVGQGLVVVLGPELFGATALRPFAASDSTALEGLLTGRIEGTGGSGAQLRVKLGAGAGIDPRFGAPEWRVVCGVEIFNHNQ